jgi:hypothetical protein
MTPADITLQQLGGRRFIAMTGAHSFLSCDDGDTLRFRLPRSTGAKVNFIKITLNWRDLYDVEFGRCSKSGGIPVYRMLSEAKNIYAEDLVPLFTRETGLDTHL